MKNYIKFLSILLMSLPFVAIQAAQKDEASVNFAQLLPNLAQGFDVLRANYYQDLPDFQDYAEEKLVNAETEGDDPLGFGLLEGLGDIVTRSEDMIFGMRDRFLGVLGWAADQHVANLDQIQDPIFRYVMQYKDAFLKPVLQEWINQKNNFGNHFRQTQTPLQWAARVHAVPVVYFLIAQGADVNAKDAGNKTALYYASMHNSLIIPLMLINAGASVNINNNDSLIAPSPLHATALRNSFAVTQLLIERGANINVTDALGETPLHIAALSNSIGAAQVLLNSSASLDIQDLNGLTPLHLAAQNDSVEVAQLLIAYHANINALDYHDKTSLMRAVENDSKNVVQLLVAQTGIDLNAQENNNQYTALHLAVVYNYLDIAQILLNAGASRTIVDEAGQTAEQRAWSPEMQAVFQASVAIQNEEG